MVSDRCQPRQHVGQLLELLVAATLADRLGEFADLLGEPRDRGGQASRSIAAAVRRSHELLELFEVHNHCIFANRQTAGRALAARLDDLAGRGDVVVLGLPRGGVPVAYEVATALGAPLDVFNVRKIGAPQQPELALGAVASGGSVVLNEDIVGHLGVRASRIDAIVDRERAVIAERDRSYRGDRPPLDVEGRVAVVIDDGIATGASMRAAVDALRARHVASLVVAAPVAPPDTASLFAGLADRVEFVATPDNFVAVGAWYTDFRQISDEEVREFLQR